VPSEADVRACLAGFVGEIEQTPPAYSAAKVTGRRAYDLARRGEDVALAPRRVQINGIDVLAYNYPLLDVEVRCGKGTYIRSLARDVGDRLGCGGFVEMLRRTRRSIHGRWSGVAGRRSRRPGRAAAAVGALAELPR
jgi:tRNA pseudouridine55 synthase